MDRRNEAVTLLPKKVKEICNQGNCFPIYRGSTNTTRRAKRSPDSSIDISGLDKVLVFEMLHSTDTVLLFCFLFNDYNLSFSHS